MKMTDPLGRVLAVDLVYKTTTESGASVWTRPLEFNLDNASTTFARLPHGAFALRVMSVIGAELIVHQDGKLLIAAQVEKGVQYIERDAQGNQLYFAPAGEDSLNIPSSDTGFGAEGVTLMSGPSSDSDGIADGAFETAAPEVPSGHGLVFVVARLAKDRDLLGSQPPQIEFECEFQLSEPAAHDGLLAANLSKFVKPDLPPNCDDLMSLTPPENLRPTFVCTCTGAHTCH